MLFNRHQPTAGSQRERDPDRVQRDRKTVLSQIEKAVRGIQERLLPLFEARTRSDIHEANQTPAARSSKKTAHMGEISGSPGVPTSPV